MSRNLKVRAINFLLAGILFGIANIGSAKAVITKCTKTKCVAKMNNGMLGETVTIMNDKAQIVAVAVITKRKGKLVLLKLTDRYAKIRKNYPIIIKRQKNYGHMYKAMFSPY